MSSCTSGGIGDGYAVVPEQFVADGNTVVALGHYARKHKSPGGRAVLKMVHVGTMTTARRSIFSATSRRHRQGSRTQLNRRTSGNELDQLSLDVGLPVRTFLPDAVRWVPG